MLASCCWWLHFQHTAHVWVESIFSSKSRQESKYIFFQMCQTFPLIFTWGEGSKTAWLEENRLIKLKTKQFCKLRLLGYGYVNFGFMVERNNMWLKSLVLKSKYLSTHPPSFMPTTFHGGIRMSCQWLPNKIAWFGAIWTDNQNDFLARTVVKTEPTSERRSAFWFQLQNVAFDVGKSTGPNAFQISAIISQPKQKHLVLYLLDLSTNLINLLLNDWCKLKPIFPKSPQFMC